MKTTITSSIEIEEIVFELETGSEVLSESPGRVSLFICSNYNSQKVYFDNKASLRHLANLINGFADILEVSKS